MLDRIKVRTGFDVKILSNSEQRFLCYKAIASRENDFNQIIGKPTAIVDVGSGSIQLSLFDKDALITTQNMRLGALRIREMLPSVRIDSAHMELLIEELIDNDLDTFRKLFLQKKEIEIATAYLTNHNVSYTCIRQGLFNKGSVYGVV